MIRSDNGEIVNGFVVWRMGYSRKNPHPRRMARVLDPLPPGFPIPLDPSPRNLTNLCIHFGHSSGSNENFFSGVTWKLATSRMLGWTICGCPMSGCSAVPTFTPGGCPTCSSSLSDISLSLLVQLVFAQNLFLLFLLRYVKTCRRF